MGPELPPPTSDRDYSKEERTVSVPLEPGTEREWRMVERFKKAIARHFADYEDKTTEQFLDDLALDLWRITRRR